MNALAVIPTVTADSEPAVAGAFKVDPHRGGTHGAVSRQWLSRPADQTFLSLGALEAHVLARKERGKEAKADTKKLEFITPTNPRSIEETHDLSIGLPDGTELSPNHYSFGQLAGLAKAPAGYLRTLPSQITADALAYGLRYNREGQDVKLYGYDDTLAAATGPDYGRIYDSEVVAAVRQVAGNGTGDTRWKAPGVLNWRDHTYDPYAPITAATTTFFASDRDCFMFLVDDTHPIEIGKLPDGSPDLVFRGFYTGNSEVGSRAMVLASFYLRGVCQNRMLWGVEGFEELTIRHTKYAPSRFIEQARPALESYANSSTGKFIEGVEKAKAARIATDDDSALEWLGNRDFSRKAALAVMAAVENEEGHKARSAWDFVQGITAVARSIPNNDDRLALEAQAGRILDKVAA